MLLGYGSDNTPIYLSNEERRRHVYLVGKTGTGKSTILEHMMRADYEHNRPFALLDPHGDLALKMASSAPPHLISRLLFFDPLDPTHAVGYNPLHNTPFEKRAIVSAQLVSALRLLWVDSWGPRMEYILLNTMRLLLDIPDATLLYIPRLLSDEVFRNKLLQKCTDPFVIRFWREEFDSYSERFQTEAIAPIQNKVGQFTINQTLREVIGQKNNINIPKLINNGHYLIVNLSKAMGEKPSHLLGAFLATGFTHAAEMRATIPETEEVVHSPPNFTQPVSYFAYPVGCFFVEPKLNK